MSPSPCAKVSVAIACGGTGGHLFPGLAVAEALKSRGCAVTLFISRKEIDQRAVRDVSGVRVVALPASGLVRGGYLAFVRGFARSWAETRRVFREGPPCAALSMGGFTGAAPMVAARFGGARLFLHESNAIPGRANRWLSRWAHQAFVGFPAAAKRLGAGKVVATGTPVRPEFGRRSLEECRRELGLDPTRPLLVVTGGSQGARGVNDLVMRGLSRIVRAVPGLQFYHLTGGVAGEKEKVMAKYASESASAQVETFSNRMDLLLGAATAAIGRAGASFLAELCALRLPAVLVPYPFAADDHQTHNAASFLDSGAAKVFREESGEIEPLVEMVRELVEEDGTRAKMRDALAQWHRPEAANQIAEAILECVAESRRRAGAPISAEEKRSPVPRCCLVFRAGGAA